jgi:hypothetical protein
MPTIPLGPILTPPPISSNALHASLVLYIAQGGVLRIIFFRIPVVLLKGNTVKGAIQLMAPAN